MSEPSKNESEQEPQVLVVGPGGIAIEGGDTDKGDKSVAEMVGFEVAVLSVVAGLLVMALEARVLLGRLGRVFEATDPASVAPVELP